MHNVNPKQTTKLLRAVSVSQLPVIGQRGSMAHCLSVRDQFLQQTDKPWWALK